jgi:adenosylcobyric acid synthase
MIKEMTGKPVAGVLPYFSDLGLPEEDGLFFEGLKPFKQLEPFKQIRIVVVRLNYISNFTDFDPLSSEPDVELIYSKSPADIENADLVIIPGSKNTVKDLLFLRESRLEKSIKRAFAKGIQITGICGGYQMLGRKIFDPCSIESPHKEVEGLGLLNIETFFENEKTTCQVEAEAAGFGDWGLGGKRNTKTQYQNPNPLLHGYEIHMGVSRGDIGLFRLRRLPGNSAPLDQDSKPLLDGSRNKNCWGTYLHGIFENNDFRRDLLNQLREKKGLEPMTSVVDYADLKEKALDRLAEMVRENLDIEFIERMLKL